jgi:hyperosmotically inducible protein
MKSYRLLTALLFFSLSTSLLADKTAGQHVDDSMVQAKVKTALMGDDFFGGAGINIEMHKGIVQLGGWVDSKEAAAAAGEKAAAVEGVKKVDNQLHVKQGEATMGQSVDDGVITTRVKSAIGGEDLGTGFNVNVDTYNGVVLLTGFVGSKDVKAQVGTLAEGVDNVKDVINGVYAFD